MSEEQEQDHDNIIQLPITVLINIDSEIYGMRIKTKEDFKTYNYMLNDDIFIGLNLVSVSSGLQIEASFSKKEDIKEKIKKEIESMN